MKVIFKNGSEEDLKDVDMIVFEHKVQNPEMENGVASWISRLPNSAMCNNCKGFAREKTKYCPHCGFKMRNYNERLYSALNFGITND